MFLQQLLNGLLLGSMYSLVAIGYSLIFGILNLLNLAHGEVFMIGGFVGLYVAVSLHQPILVSVVAAAAGAGLCGLLLEITCFRYVKKEYPMAPLLATVGFALILSNLASLVSGAEPRMFPMEIDLGYLQVGDLYISNLQLTMFVFAVLLMIVIDLIVKKTGIGRCMRATAENANLSRLVGIDIRQVTRVILVLSSALGGAAGILVGMRMGKVSPFIGSTIGLKALAVMVIGGLTEVRGSMFTGLIIGVIEVLVVAYLSSSYVDGVVWVLLIMILLYRPSGLFGSFQPEKL